MTLEQILAIQQAIKRAAFPPRCLGRELVALCIIDGKVKAFYGRRSDFAAPRPSYLDN